SGHGSWVSEWSEDVGSSCEIVRRAAPLPPMLHAPETLATARSLLRGAPTTMLMQLCVPSGPNVAGVHTSCAVRAWYACSQRTPPYSATDDHRRPPPVSMAYAACSTDRLP